jgi:hypothetical protein
MHVSCTYIYVCICGLFSLSILGNKINSPLTNIFIFTFIITLNVPSSIFSNSTQNHMMMIYFKWSRFKRYFLWLYHTMSSEPYKRLGTSEYSNSRCSCCRRIPFCCKIIMVVMAVAALAVVGLIGGYAATNPLHASCTVDW